MDELQAFQGRRVLITGHTGFKGSWLSLWLLKHSAVVSGYSVDVPTVPSLFESLGLAADIRHHQGDIRDRIHLLRALAQEQPEIIFHLAAQPLVRRSYEQPQETFEINLGGTVNLLEAVRKTDSVRAVVCVTSDKCYENRDWPGGYRESDPLGGSDPYSASKACAELAVNAYRESCFPSEPASEHRVGLSTVRAGNVIGGGDWAMDRIVPDCIRALVSDESIEVRRPEAVRPWQHVLEPLAGYLILTLRLLENPGEFAGVWNFGPTTASTHSVADLVAEILKHWGPRRSQVLLRSHSNEPAEAACLLLCSDKARTLLPWQPLWSFRTAVKLTVEWYRAFYDKGDSQELRQLCLEQIKQYEAKWSGSLGRTTDKCDGQDDAETLEELGWLPVGLRA